MPGLDLLAEEELDFWGVGLGGAGGEDGGVQGFEHFGGELGGGFWFLGGAWMRCILDVLDNLPGTRNRDLSWVIGLFGTGEGIGAFYLHISTVCRFLLGLPLKR